MDLSELERLVQIVQGASISVLTIRQGEARITLRKAPVEAPVGLGELVVTHGEYYDDEDADLGSVDDDTDLVPQDLTAHVTAPLVGTFHHIKPHIGLGARVTEGQVVGVIEAMKLITDVTSPGTGVIVDTHIEDGLPVEYGQQLFTVQLEGKS